MSDPLLIIASVVGLVTTSAKVANIAKQLYDSGKMYPPPSVALARRWLLDRSAVADSTDSNSCTLLLYSVWYSHEDICKLLLGQGTAVDSTDSNGRTSLSFAV